MAAAALRTAVLSRPHFWERVIASVAIVLYVPSNNYDL
jgi:hypothetical protein